MSLEDRLVQLDLDEAPHTPTPISQLSAQAQRLAPMGMAKEASTGRARRSNQLGPESPKRGPKTAPKPKANDLFSRIGPVERSGNKKTASLESKYAETPSKKEKSSRRQKEPVKRVPSESIGTKYSQEEERKRNAEEFAKQLEELKSSGKSWADDFSWY